MRTFVIGLAIPFLLVLLIWGCCMFGYRAGLSRGNEEGELNSLSHIEQIVRDGHVYLAPLHITEPTTLGDCIFICIEPNKPNVIVDANLVIEGNLTFFDARAKIVGKD